MLQVRRDLDLAQEPLDAEHGAELGLEDLERDLALVPDVAREVDRRHAAFADLPLDGVAAGEGGIQLVGVHGGRREGAPSSVHLARPELEGGWRKAEVGHNLGPIAPEPVGA